MTESLALASPGNDGNFLASQGNDGNFQEVMDQQFVGIVEYNFGDQAGSFISDEAINQFLDAEDGTRVTALDPGTNNELGDGSEAGTGAKGAEMGTRVTMALGTRVTAALVEPGTRVTAFEPGTRVTAS